jgi:transcriptional regulator with XRE-family HTH domain
MASKAQTSDIRSKMIGVLLRAARLRSGKTVKQCAEWLGCSAHIFSQYEYGRRPVSLPELELLARLFRVPVRHLYDDTVAVLGVPSAKSPPQQILRIRHKEIGVLLREARSRAGMTQKQCAEILSTSTDTVSKYEHGSKAVPFAHLELLAEFLGIPVSNFRDRGLEAECGSQLLPPDEVWGNLPPEIKRFICEADSLPYLEMALRLSELPADSLRHLAEAMLSAEDSAARATE